MEFTRWFGDYNEGELLFLGAWSPITLGLFLAAALVILGLTWVDMRGLRPARRVAILGLRAAALCLSVLALAEPALELRNVSRVKNHVAVLVDDSASGTLPADDEATRAERTRAALERLAPRLRAPSEDHVYDVWTFDETLQPSSLDAALSPGHLPDGRRTDLLGALRGIGERHGRNALGGIVLISDGADNATLGGRVRPGEPLDAETRRVLERLGAPVHTVLNTTATDLRDIAIERVRHNDFVFARNATRVVAEIRVTGYTEGIIPITLRREGVPLQTRELRIEPDTRRYEVEFEFVPELIGKEIFTVEAPVRKDEALATNNIDAFVLRIIRDKIRVLQVVGRPSWDQRALRQFLKTNPNVDLISFFILRTHEDLTKAPDSALSLIPFPVDELFNEQLGSFDLVVFQNIPYGPYGMRRYMPLIARYVREGGGFLMIGGDQSFGSGGYGTTEVADVLPVGIPASGSSSTLIDDAPFRAALTDAGRRHPITRLEFDDARNEALWRSLPTLDGANVLLAAQRGATVLATHPSRRAGGAPMPVIAVADVAQGRSMAIASDSVWKWSFHHVLDGGTSRPYTAFWNSAIRWLIRDPELNLLQIGIPREVFAPGDEFAATIRVFRSDYTPAVATEGTWRLIRRDADAPPEAGSEAGEAVPFTTDDTGRFVVRGVAGAPGAWRLEASVRDEDGELLVADEVFLVSDRDAERRTIDARPDLLTALAAGSVGGTSSTWRDVGSLPFRPAQVVEVNRRRVVDLWNGWPILLALVLLLGTEWTLRRRWGRL